MSKFVGIKTYERFRSLWENNDIDEFSLNFILDTGQLYTHGVFINSAVFGTAANGAVLLSIAGTTNTLALSSHTHSNYYDKSENLDITNHKIISGDNDLLFCSGGALYIGNIDNPTYISGSTIQSIKGLNTYTILDTENFSISNTLPTGYTHNNTAYIEYGGNSFLIDYVKRVNTSLSFDYLNSYTLAGTNLLNGDYYGYINFTVDNVYNNPAWAQLRINITGRSIQYRTSADVNNWINLGIPSIPLNALNVAGIVSAPNSSTQNKVWKTDEDGNPGWRDERIYSFASLVFQLIAGTELESYNTLTLKTILAGSNISFSCEDNVITINALDTTYSTFTGASASEDGSSGLVTVPNTGDQDKFLRGDGTWNTPLNTWRPIYLLGTATLSNSSTYLNIAPGNNISLAYAAPGTETGLSGNANYATLTISATNTWIAWEGATETNNGTAGYMPAPTSALRNLFLRGDGTWISLNDYTLPTATNLVLGGIKVGTTLEDVSGYTAIHIKDGVAYYKDTTYSFSNLLFLQTSGTNLMTYNSQAARTILAGSNITFTHSNNILTIAAKDTTYSTVSKTAAGLCPILPNETTTTKYLRLDGTWLTPPDNNTWKDFTGASASAAGTKGVIQAPAGAQNKFFRGDNTWQTISQNVTSALYVGASNGTGNSAQSTNGNVYLIFAEGSSYSRYKISGSGRASVTSDASGNITINSSGYSNFGAATASAAGSAGLVPAPGTNILGSSGYYLRADGTWLKPPNDNTWKAANASQEGYVPKSTANKILRANGDGALYWGDDANTTYTFYNLQFQNSGGTTVDTYKPTTSPTKTLKAGSNVTISAASNIITIASTNTWNAMTGATSSANGTVGYVNATPPKDGYNTKFLRADGTWSVPAYPTKSSWNYNDMYVSSLTINGNYLRWVKNGSNNDITIPYATNANIITRSTSIANAEQLDNFHSNGLKWAQVSGILNPTGNYINNNDGLIISIPWSSTYGLQFYIDDSGYTIMHRYCTLILTSAEGVEPKTYGRDWKNWVVMLDTANSSVSKSGETLTVKIGGTSQSLTNTNTWNANAVGVAGYVAAPTKAANANMVWKTDSNGNPAWRADANDNTLYYLTLNGTVNGTSGKTNLGTIWAPTSKGTGFLKCNDGTWSYDNTTYATSGHNHDSNYVIKKYYSAEQNTDATKFWIRDIALDYPCSIIYNNSGSEWTYWVGLNTSNKQYGHIIRCSYANSGTLQFMYKSGGTADNTTNWSGWINVAHSNNSSLSTSGTTATIKVLGSSADVSLTSHNHNSSYLSLSGGTMLLGEGLKFHSDENYFGSNLDARIISLLDSNGTTCDGGLIIDERATSNGTTTVTELLRIRHDEFKWKGLTIYHSGNLPAYPTKASWNYNDMYVASVSISGNNLRVNKNGTNTDLTIPYASHSTILNYSSQVGADTIDGFLEANCLKACVFSVKGLLNSNGLLISGGYTNTTYGFLLAIDDDPNWGMALRLKSTNWGAWKKIPMGDGTNASGTWGISITGNADTVDNIHANGLLTAASLGASGNSTTLSVTVGGTTKTGSVTVPFATSATNATNATVLLTNNTSQAADSCYTGAPGLRFWRYNGTSSTTGQGGGDGWIMSWSWNSGSLGGQIYVDDNPSKTMCIRGYNNANGGSFTTWATMLHTDNWKSYITCSTLGAALADHTHTSFGNLTINGVITIGKNDNYGLAATANYSQLGFVDKYFWKCHVGNMYADNISSRDETKAPAFPKGLTSVANITAANFYTTSDRLKKQNISELSEHIRKFQMKDTKTWHYGVIAQEVPEIFRDGEEGNMTVNYNSVLSYYVGQLENRVKELELEVLKLKKNNYDNTK